MKNQCLTALFSPCRAIGVRANRMKLIDAFYDELADSMSADAEYILGAALEHAEPGWFERIEGLLLKKSNDLARGALLGCYTRLTPTVRETLLKDPDQFTSALAQTVKLPSAAMRESGLTLLADHCKTSLTYLLPPALRDSVARNRAAAARALVQVAQAVREKDCHLASSSGSVDEAHAAMRTRLVITIREALGIYERYPQIEILQVACWFARELSRSLWQLLERHNGKVGATVFRKMPDWNHHYMAEFLLQALGRHPWRGEAARRLQEWSSPEEISSLLALTDLLKEPAVCEGLNQVRFPIWFRQLDERLSQLPPELRPHAPAWVLATGIRVANKRMLLESWQVRGDADLKSAATAALEKLAAGRASSRGPVQPGAAQPENPAAPQPSAGTVDSEPPATAATITRPGDLEGDFDVLWSSCRRLPARKRAELIGLLREQAPLFADSLRDKLMAGDARDRILGLQIVGTRELGEQFLADLAMLQQDTVDAIRSLACSAVDELQRLGENPARSSAVPLLPAAGRAATPADRDQLDLKLQELMQDVELGANEEFVAGLHAALRLIYPFAPQAPVFQEQIE